MPFTSTVTSGESKSRSGGPGGLTNRLSSTGNALMFDRRKTRVAATSIEKRASTQLSRLPDLEADEKRRILEDAGKVSQLRNINIDNYLA